MPLAPVDGRPLASDWRRAPRRCAPSASRSWSWRRSPMRSSSAPLRVQEAGALRQRVDARQVLRGELQDRLHRVRRQRRIGLEHQRDAVPATIGAAMLVPLSVRYGRAWSGCRSHRTPAARDSSLNRKLPGAASEIDLGGRARPGRAWRASRSATGRASCSRPYCRHWRSTVPFVIAAPTVIAHGALPGRRDAAVADLAGLRVDAEVAGGGRRPTMPCAHERFDRLHQRVGRRRTRTPGGRATG